MGVAGKRGRKRCFSEAVGGVSVRRIANRRLVLAEFGGFTAIFICREHSFPNRFAKISFDSGSVMIITGGTPVPLSQVYSRTRVRPSSNWISGACHVGLTPSPGLRSTS